MTFPTLIRTGLRVCLPLLDTSSYSVYFENIKTALCYLGPMLDYFLYLRAKPLETERAGMDQAFTL